MAKYEIKIEVKPPEGELDTDAPTIAEVEDIVQAALRAAFPGAAVRTYGGSRPDLD